MIKKITAIFVLLFSINFSAQTLRLIDTSDFEIRKKLTKNLKKTHSLFYKSLKKEYKGKLRIEITNLYKSKHKEFLKNVNKEKIIFDTLFTKYTDSLSKVIINSNPKLKDKNLSIYISKNPSINALNIGDGIIFLNIGLFKYFENEDQLVSVLSHEIAHENLNHVSDNMIRIAKLRTSKLRKDQARRIKKEKYNTYDKSFSILKNLLYSDSKTHRKKEMQADSVGYLLYKNTTLYKPNYISALQLLADYEKLPTINLDSTVYRRFFDIPKQPFKDSWLKMEKFSDYDYSKYTEKINKDSVKSHPEFTERILKLKKDFPELSINDSLSKSSKGKTFSRLQKIAKEGDIVNFYDLEEYGYSIRLILHKLSKDSTNSYLKKWLGKNFLSLYKAKKKYQLNRYIERINPKKQTKEYQQFLSFIWNLNLEEIKNIGDYYTEN
ncbi:M48 family metalloprotease [Polaribacter sp. Hel1_85]|uniref:M48 family metalloprotease n=1 Tax=Polaribacter sp. Hel1_85 TaxID=1250005 RepID=UPI00052C979D|nr:M48 family metalloprotease [Polaribacter sp. Hel1_85]KGL63110.1 peptidase, M48 family [Polaribacter sp. Hel1_85]